MPQNGATKTAHLSAGDLRLTIDTVLRELHTGPDTRSKDCYEQMTLL